MRLFNQRDGILSLADARRDANLSRVGARDQYETDVADFKDSFVTDLEKDFMSSGDTYMNPSNILPPSVPLDIPQKDVFLPPRFIEEDFFVDDPIQTPPTFIDEFDYTPPNIDFTLPPIADDRIIDTPPPMDLPPPSFIDDDFIYTPPTDNIYDDIFMPPKPPVDEIFKPPFEIPVDDIFIPPFEPPVDMPPPFKPPVDDIFIPPFEPPFTPPMDPPFTPPIDIPPPGYRPPGDGRFPPNKPPYDDGIIDPPFYLPPDDGFYDDEDEDKDGPYDPPYDPPQDPPYTPPVNTPAPRRMYRPPTDFSSGAPKVQLPRGLNVGIFGQAPGFEPPPPPQIIQPRPPIDGPPIMCFVAGTKVNMADGTKKVIENIAIGDEVLALNGEADVVSYVHDIPKADRNLWTINDRITATDAHAFLTKDGWKSNNSKLSNTVYNDYGIEVKDLEIGDKLITNDGVEEVTKLENEKDFVKVYNFTTSNTHTYMVDGVVSHNKLPPRPPGEGPRPIKRIMEPKDMKLGGGISMLPMNGQGDTLTTQVFQAGFRPRR